MKNTSIRWAIPTLLVLGGLTSLVSAEGHLKNGNFDQDKDNPKASWTLDPAKGLQTPAGVTGVCIWLNEGGSRWHDPSISQDMTDLKVGTQYIVSGKYKVGKTANLYAKPGAPMLAVEIDKVRKVACVALASKTDPKKMDETTWQTFSVGFTATKTIQNLCIKGEIDGKDADVYVDDVAVDEVPPVLTNGSFDTENSFDSWGLEFVDKTIANQHETLKDGTKNGYVWLNYNGTAKDPAITQDLKGLKVGATYIVSGKYRTGKGAHMAGIKPGDALLAVDIDRKQVGDAVTAPAAMEDANKLDLTHWMSFSATFTATKDTQQLRIRGEVDGKDGDVYVDDVSVAELAK